VYDQTVEMFAMGIEMFIMLHEYGHVALGHLGTCSLMPLRMKTGGELTLYTNSQLQEFEADEFAFKHYSSSGMRSTDVAFSCGLLFHFFHLAELIRPPQSLTHPPGLARWQKIKNVEPLSAHPESWANFLDDAFAALAEGLPRL
jgi:Zn-dependent protease with chaperone function